MRKHLIFFLYYNVYKIKNNNNETKTKETKRNKNKRQNKTKPAKQNKQICHSSLHTTRLEVVRLSSSAINITNHSKTNKKRKRKTL